METKKTDHNELESIKDFAIKFIKKMNLRESDIKSEGYWYISKDTYDGVNLKSLIEKCIFEYQFEIREKKFMDLHENIKKGDKEHFEWLLNELKKLIKDEK